MSSVDGETGDDEIKIKSLRIQVSCGVRK
jgi:hypothetical protein